MSDSLRPVDCSAPSSSVHGILQARLLRHGKTLNALQRLIKLTIQNKYNENIKIRVEISNYRKNQEDQLKRKIKKIAKDVIKTKMDIKLDPMNSYQRRIVHEVIKEYSELKSESIGESPNRYIVISIKD